MPGFSEPRRQRGGGWFKRFFDVLFGSYPGVFFGVKLDGRFLVSFDYCIIIIIIIIIYYIIFIIDYFFDYIIILLYFVDYRFHYDCTNAM